MDVSKSPSEPEAELESPAVVEKEPEDSATSSPSPPPKTDATKKRKHSPKRIPEESETFKPDSLRRDRKKVERWAPLTVIPDKPKVTITTGRGTKLEDIEYISLMLKKVQAFNFDTGYKIIIEP